MIKVGRAWLSNQNIVMNEELVQNSVMNKKMVQNGVMKEKFVKNFVINAKIHPKVVMELSIFMIGRWQQFAILSIKNCWKNLLMRMNRSLLFGLPSREPFLATQDLERHSASSDQHMKKLMSLREGLHVMMQCYMRQHFADRYWLHERPGGHASWMRTYDEVIHKRINHVTFVKGRVCR